MTKCCTTILLPSHRKIVFDTVRIATRVAHDGKAKCNNVVYTTTFCVPPIAVFSIYIAKIGNVESVLPWDRFYPRICKLTVPLPVWPTHWIAFKEGFEAKGQNGIRYLLLFHWENGIWATGTGNHEWKKKLETGLLFGRNIGSERDFG